MPSISGSTLLVIGGSSGIGFAVAQAALGEGVRVAIASSNSEKVDDAVARLKTSYPKGDVAGYVCNFRTPELEPHLEDVLTKVTAAHGGELLDHIAITAGDYTGTIGLPDVTQETFIKVVEMRLLAPTLVAKLALRFLKKSVTSSITFTAGGVVLRPYPGWPLSSCFAGGLEGLTLGLAVDMAPQRINIVHPGATVTEFWGPGREDRAKQMAEKQLLGQVGRPEEVAEAYIYSMKNTNLTAGVLHTNGGMHLK